MDILFMFWFMFWLNGLVISFTGSGILLHAILHETLLELMVFFFTVKHEKITNDSFHLQNVDQVAVWEQLGRVTNALCWCFSEPHQ